MPPRTRAAKVSKGLKENIDTNNPKIKAKAAAKGTKVVRKPLADKTNSASDDNGSIEVTKVTPKKNVNSRQKLKANDKDRPRRERRPPTRFIEHANDQENVLNTSQGKIKLSNQLTPNDQGKQNSPRDQTPECTKKTDTKSENKVSNSPFKTPQDLNNSLVANRPKRIHRLPSKFDDHSISPSKFIPVQPCFASTPIRRQNMAKELKTTQVKKPTETSTTDEPERPLRNTRVQKSVPVQKKPECDADYSTTRQIRQKSTQNNAIRQKRTIRNAGADSSKQSLTKRPLKSNDIELILSGDTNNNSNYKRPASVKNASPKKAVYSKVSKTQGKRIINKSLSFRVLEEKVKSPKNPQEKLAVYDFTFDPNEEPPPQKKKRKRVVNKKGPAKPRVVRVKNNYEANLAKNLASLKQAVTKAVPETKTHSEKIVLPTVPEQNINDKSTEEAFNKPARATFVEPSIPPLDTMDYSPVASPNDYRPQVKMSDINETRDPIHRMRATSLISDNRNSDPLNLLEEMSFFDEVPVASSSMNISVRHPTASPWRVDFNNLPVKWQSDAYVKPNMTPAVECSFINLGDKKKHVYTNILPEADTSLPVPSEPDSNLVQPTIIDFMREMAEKSLKKKRNKTSVTPTKKANDRSSKTPNKDDNATNVTPIENMSPLPPPTNSSVSTFSDADNSDPMQTPLKRKKLEDPSELPAKSPRLEANADNCFGFDDSENQENISPRKVDKPRVRALRPRSRAVLNEINAITGPLRAKIPLAAKNKFAPSSEVVTKLFDEMKASNPSEIVVKDIEKEKQQETEKQKEKEVASDVSDPSWQESVVKDTESQSVHLFEDIDVVHHIKPVRKSYGNAKKVTFCQRADSVAQETADHDEEGSEDGENPLDLPFQVPTIKQKKLSKKKKKKGLKLTKKEEEEVEAWAAAFNSMCEDVEEFPLVLE